VRRRAQFADWFETTSEQEARGRGAGGLGRTGRGPHLLRATTGTDVVDERPRRGRRKPPALHSPLPSGHLGSDPSCWGIWGLTPIAQGGGGGPWSRGPESAKRRTFPLRASRTRGPRPLVAPVLPLDEDVRLDHLHPPERRVSSQQEHVVHAGERRQHLDALRLRCDRAALALELRTEASAVRPTTSTSPASRANLRSRTVAGVQEVEAAVREDDLLPRRRQAARTSSSSAGVRPLPCRGASSSWRASSSSPRLHRHDAELHHLDSPRRRSPAARPSRGRRPMASTIAIAAITMSPAPLTSYTSRGMIG